MRFKYCLLEEIYEQPKALTSTLENGLEPLKSLGRDDIPKKIIFLGMGSSFYVSLYAEYLFSRFSEINVDAVLASEQLYYPKPIDNKSLVIAISQSGETIETVKVVEELKKKGIKVWSVTNSAKSTLAEISDYSLLTYAGEEKCSSTKTFTSAIALIYMLWTKVGVSRRYFRANIIEESKLKILEISETIRDNLDLWNDLCRSLALNVNNSRSVVILGRGYNFCTALQAALLFKEVSKTHAEAMSGGQFRHGPIELLSPELMVISLAAGTTKDLMIKIAEEARMFGGNAMLISDSKEYAEISDICLNEVDEPLSPLLFIVPLQMIAYNSAIFKKRNPDRGEYFMKVTRTE